MTQSSFHVGYSNPWKAEQDRCILLNQYIGKYCWSNLEGIVSFIFKNLETGTCLPLMKKRCSDAVILPWGLFLSLKSGTRQISFAEQICREFLLSQYDGNCLIYNQKLGNMKEHSPHQKEMQWHSDRFMWDSPIIGNQNKTYVFYWINM